jgi:hypothetical protein
MGVGDSGGGVGAAFTDPVPLFKASFMQLWTKRAKTLQKEAILGITTISYRYILYTVINLWLIGKNTDQGTGTVVLETNKTCIIS